MIINDLFNNKKFVAEGMSGNVVFSGTGADGSTYEIIQSGPTDFMIHANGRHIDTYGSLQRAMSVLKNEVPGLQQGMAEGTLDEAVGMMIKGAAISGANDQDIADRIAAKTGGRVDSGSYGHHVLITYPTTQHRAEAAVKIRKMFPGIELYKSGGNRNAIDEQGVAKGLNEFAPPDDDDDYDDEEGDDFPEMFEAPFTVVINGKKQTGTVIIYPGEVTSAEWHLKDTIYIKTGMDNVHNTSDFITHAAEYIQEIIRLDGRGHNYVKHLKKRRGVAEGKVKLYTDPSYFGAEVDDAGFDSLPVVNIPTTRLVGFEPDSKMQQPKAMANVKNILAGLEQGDNIPPILVRKYKNGYQVLDGHHRFWAYKVAKKDTIPARVVDPKDIEEVGKQGVAEDDGFDDMSSYANMSTTDTGNKSNQTYTSTAIAKNPATGQQKSLASWDHTDPKTGKNYSGSNYIDAQGNAEVQKNYEESQDQLDELDKKTVASWVRQQPERIKGDTGLSRTNFKKAKRLVDKSIPSAIAKYKDPGYGKQEKRMDEVSVPKKYREKAQVSQAMAQTNKFFGRDDPAAVAAADRTIANRTKGLARADARRKPYTAPPVDQDKQRRDLADKYPNIDELVRQAELRRDPQYDRADGQAYYNGRDAEHNYHKLKQIQRMIRGTELDEMDFGGVSQTTDSDTGDVTTNFSQGPLSVSQTKTPGGYTKQTDQQFDLGTATMGARTVGPNISAGQLAGTTTKTATNNITGQAKQQVKGVGFGGASGATVGKNYVGASDDELAKYAADSTFGVNESVNRIRHLAGIKPAK